MWMTCPEERVPSHSHSLNQFCHFPPPLRPFPFQALFLSFAKTKQNKTQAESLSYPRKRTEAPRQPRRYFLASTPLACCLSLLLSLSIGRSIAAPGQSDTQLVPEEGETNKKQTQSGLHAKRALATTGEEYRRGKETHNAPKRVGSLHVNLPDPVWRFCFFSQRIKQPLSSHLLPKFP